MSLQARLKDDLTAAMRRRDRPEIEVLRNLISAIDNAGAVEAVPDPLPKLGLGFDVPRKELSTEDVRQIIVAERAELLDAARVYRDLGRLEEAATLESQAETAARFLR